MDALRRQAKLLGELFLSKGLITEQELSEALAEQERNGGRLGEILVEHRLVSGPQLTTALAEQLGVEVEREDGFPSGLWTAIRNRHPRTRTDEPSPSQEDSNGEAGFLLAERRRGDKELAELQWMLEVLSVCLAQVAARLDGFNAALSELPHGAEQASTLAPEPVRPPSGARVAEWRGTRDSLEALRLWRRSQPAATRQADYSAWAADRNGSLPADLPRLPSPTTICRRLGARWSEALRLVEGDGEPGRPEGSRRSRQRRR